MDCKDFKASQGVNGEGDSVLPLNFLKIKDQDVSKMHALSQERLSHLKFRSKPFPNRLARRWILTFWESALKFSFALHYHIFEQLWQKFMLQSKDIDNDVICVKSQKYWHYAWDPVALWCIWVHLHNLASFAKIVWGLLKNGNRKTNVKCMLHVSF